MVDRPLLFSAPIVRALLAGRKTQTRRVLRPQPYEFAHPSDGSRCWNASGVVGGRIAISDAHLLRLHKSRIGDRLWVRETVRAEEDDQTFDHCVRYCADDACVRVAEDGDVSSDAFGQWWLLSAYRSSDPDLTGGKRVPPIHMPRWASRLTLVVTDVRVQRLQDISDEDAVAEGIEAGRAIDWMGPDHTMRDLGPRDGFCALWNKLHGPGAWSANPWVAALTFAVHHTNIDTMPAPTPASRTEAGHG